MPKHYARSSTLQGVAQTWAGLRCSAAHCACRQLLNDVWRQFTNISSPVTSNVNADLEYSREVSEVGVFEAPEAANTTILVVGGTGRCAVALTYGARGPTPRAHPWMASASPWCQGRLYSLAQQHVFRVSCPVQIAECRLQQRLCSV